MVGSNITILWIYFHRNQSRGTNFFEGGGQLKVSDLGLSLGKCLHFFLPISFMWMVSSKKKNLDINFLFVNREWSFFKEFKCFQDGNYECSLRFLFLVSIFMMVLCLRAHGLSHSLYSHDYKVLIFNRTAIE